MTGDQEWQRRAGQAERGLLEHFRYCGFCDIRAEVTGLSRFIRYNGAKSVVYSLSEARISGGTGSDLALQCAATHAHGTRKLVAPHVLPVGSKIIVLGEEIGH
jgi:hypothetical protein